MKKIWDSQNNQTLYAVDEQAMHKAVKAKKKSATRMVSFNEIGLIIINLAMGVMQYHEWYYDGRDPWDLVMGVLVTLIAVFLVIIRLRRKKHEERYDRSMLGELEHAISGVKSLIWISTSMVWWYMAPIGVLVFGKFLIRGADWYSWLFVIGMFALAMILITWERRRWHYPRLEKLKMLKAKLLEEV